MASKNQYSQFAVIAFSAIQMQLNHVNDSVADGCVAKGGEFQTLLIAQNTATTILNYGTDCLSVPSVKEIDIVKLCDWLQATLKFTVEDIGSMTGLTVNEHQYDPNDFNDNQYA